MNDPEIRVGDAEREEALRALGDHMSAGRLDIDEYGERTARVAASKTRGDLLELFKDLPAPKPTFIAQPVVQPQAQPVPAMPGPAPPQRWSGSRTALKTYAALIPVVWVLAVMAFFVVKVPFVFLLPVFVMIAGARMWGADWHEERRNQRRHREQWRHNQRRHRGRY
ncbi:DUF1707 SHOCT-like domain-containing protein [Kibdelosporangium phytohabitans]|uniref:DUF1707 domain-containing protein n=1 Tax=Kibdelosporangium phytohabitans TaxID=860235 RepID=A0A0N9IFR0_9PSEU|nr:DUF1707 domain-containing protein [Kibdelosporangium phytohabitans]ALG13654.1 hypothetical protein AOZ06_48430 [Kibdelosporangium phytohabitans]MBE1465539.1 hypothetical protein [Kibdelosporangium phytohabitans]